LLWTPHPASPINTPIKIIISRVRILLSYIIYTNKYTNCKFIKWPLLIAFKKTSLNLILIRSIIFRHHRFGLIPFFTFVTVKIFSTLTNVDKFFEAFF